MKHISSELTNVLKKEETKARQRSRENNIFDGDRSTPYFHSIANEIRRKKQTSGHVQDTVC
jgi:hypothetical protein